MTHQSFLCISNFEQYNNEEKQGWIERLDQLADSTLSDIIQTRFSTHLSANNEDVNHPAWDWCFENISCVAAILKLNHMVKKDQTLKETTSSETLFAPNFVCNHESLTIIVFSERYRKEYHNKIWLSFYWM